jgi:hypothetical protein
MGWRPTATPSGLVQGLILQQSAVAVPHTGDTNETILATIAVPANALGKNGRLTIDGYGSVTNSANNKTFRVRWGASGSGLSGAQMSLVALTTVATARLKGDIENVNATNAQKSYANLNAFTSSAPVQTGAIDTTAATEINITGQLALGSETITLEAYQVLLYPHS